MSVGTVSKKSVGAMSEKTVGMVVLVKCREDVTDGSVLDVDKNAGGNIGCGWQYNRAKI